MTRHDGERPQPDGTPPPDRPAERSEATETTGSWAFISPFAASPSSHVPPTGAADRTAPAPGPDEGYAGSEAPAAAGRPEWGPAGQPGRQNSAAGAIPGGSSTPDAPAQPPTWALPSTPSEPPIWGAPAAPDPGGRPPSRWKTWQKVAAGGVLAGVVAVGGVAAVSAANASSTTGTTQAGFGGVGQGFTGGESGRADGGQRGAMAGVMALANALHGDFVVSSGSGTQTMRLQVGELTAMASDSVTVTSTDSYSSTYAIGAGVDVSGLTQGATVRVIATVDGDTATATSVTAESAAGFGGAAGQDQPGRGQGESGLQPPQGMVLPDGGQPPQGSNPTDDTDQAPQTS